MYFKINYKVVFFTERAAIKSHRLQENKNQNKKQRRICSSNGSWFRKIFIYCFQFLERKAMTRHRQNHQYCRRESVRKKKL